MPPSTASDDSWRGPRPIRARAEASGASHGRPMWNSIGATGEPKRVSHTRGAPMIVIISKKEREILDGLRLLKQIEDGTNGLPGQIVKLKMQISDLEVQRSRREEEVARQERELKHMIGLEKKRQKWEIEVAKKDTSLTVREGNLA